MELELEFLLTHFLRLFFLITAPVTLLVGIFLLYDINTYLRIEKFVARSFGPARLREALLVKIEHNRDSLQLFLIKRRRFFGFVCLLNALFAIFITLTLFKR